MVLTLKQEIAVKQEIHRLKLIIASDKLKYREARYNGESVSSLVGLCNEITEYQNILYLLKMERWSELPYIFKTQFPL